MSADLGRTPPSAPDPLKHPAAAEAGFAGRRDELSAGLAGRKLDALLVSALSNVRYLTGFTGSSAMLLVFAGGGAILFTDPRYAIQAAQQAGCRVKVCRGPLLPGVVAAALRRRVKTLGFERNRLGFDAYDSLRSAMPLDGALEPVAGAVERLRLVKSPAEIALLRSSAATNSRAFEEAVRRIRPGMLETELAAEIDYRMRRLGAEKPSFDTIVAAGARSALPHASPTATPFRARDLLLVDMGATRQGYASDMTRMLSFGTPSRRVRRLYDAVREAQSAALAAVRAGVTAGSVDRAARTVLRALGYGRAFTHSTGHGLGLEIHEPPRLARREKLRLEAGMAITVEPGAYIEGFGGVRVEDTVVVTPNGCEILTLTTKELRVL